MIIPQTISIIVIITKNLIILRIISNLSRTALRNDLFCDSSESKPGQYLQISEYSSSVISNAFFLLHIENILFHLSVYNPLLENLYQTKDCIFLFHL